MAERRICILHRCLESLQHETDQILVGRIARLLGQLAKGDLASSGDKPLTSIDCRQADINVDDRLLHFHLDIEGSPWDAVVAYCRHDDAIRTARHYAKIRLECCQEGRLVRIPNEALSSAEAFSDWLRVVGTDAEFLLSSQQRQAVRNREIVLIEGGAGTGKTSVLLHALRERRDPSRGRTLYVTFSAHLLDRAMEQLGGLEHGDEIKKTTGFLTIVKLTQNVGGLDGDPFSKDEFFRWLKDRHQDSRRFRAPVAWGEIRGFLRGYALNSGATGLQQILSREAYEHLPQREGFVTRGQRERFYQLGVAYTRNLRDSGRFDDMDLAAAALGRVEDHPGEIDLIIADEIQDLTRLQIDFLKALAATKGAELIVAGDLDQTIYPSGFDWKYLYDGRKTFKLQANYRSTQPILTLAQGVLERIKDKAMKGFSKEGGYQAPTRTATSVEARDGEVPSRWCAKAVDLDRHLEQLEASPKRVTLARSRGEVERLRTFSSVPGRARQLVDELDEYKGLEQETVLLYRFFAPEADFWKRCIRGEGDPGDKLTVLNEVNRLYVAVTRAQKRLVFLDDPDDPTPWAAFGMDEWVDSRDSLLEALGQIDRQNFSAQDWLAEARRQERQERYEQAADAYSNASDADSARRCLAWLERKNGRFEEAAQEFSGLGLFDEAKECYRVVRSEQGVRRCEAEIKLQSGDVAGAIKDFGDLGDWGRVVHLHEQLGEFAKAERFLDRCSPEAQAAFMGRRVLREFVPTARRLMAVESA